MSLLKALEERSGTACELCSATNNLTIYEVPPVSTVGIDGSVLLCELCKEQIEGASKMDTNHWRCLNESMWSEHAAVQVLAWRMLSRLKDQGWPQDLLDMLHLDEPIMSWAKATGEDQEEVEQIIHRDSNGVVLKAGDSVVLIKDLKVKGSSMIAKQGKALRRISLDQNNAEYIEGKIDGQHIVIITKYVKKM